MSVSRLWRLKCFSDPSVFGRRIDVRIFQRGRRFELAVRATTMNEGSSKMTTDNFVDCDNDKDEACSADHILVESDLTFFHNQRPMLVTRSKPLALSKKRADVKECLTDFESDGQWSKGAD